MLVILEGVDGSGKTTLLNQLLDKGYMCKKSLRENNEIDKTIYNFAKYHDKILILDRSFITDAVYRCVQGGVRESFDMKKSADILDKGVKIIYCTTNTSFNDAMQRGEDNITDAEVHSSLKNAYDFVMNYIRKYTDTKVMNYNWRYMSIDSVIKFIEGGDNNDTVSV